ncbi:hypothetical protein ACSBM8_12230 [Sphingomonas sp. ASY06-1R]|uniref:hypothetical protein n=1 Tax=Sphingomonas sp. ASY06-1R TaxID=3445771 RepID=UPI003FA2B172
MTDGTPMLRQFDDETLLDMYDHAHETGDAHCDAIAAELGSRGIEVKPCGHAHRLGDFRGVTRDGG